MSLSMKEPIFARTRYHYDSYTDFWKLVELSGFRTCFVDQIDLEQDEIYIASPVNGELRPHVTHRRSILREPQKAKIIWWNLERPEKTDFIKSNDEGLNYVSAIWASDRGMCLSDSRVIYTEFGSHPDLNRFGTLPKVYDFAHLSYVTPRRLFIYSSVSARGFRAAPDLGPAKRGESLALSRLMFSVHQNDLKICEPIRYAVAAAYKMPLIAEAVVDSYPLEHEKNCFIATYEMFVDSVTRCLSRDALDLGEVLHKRLAVDFDFRQGVVDSLRRTPL